MNKKKLTPEVTKAAVRILQDTCLASREKKASDPCSVCSLHVEHPEIGDTCIFDYMGIPPADWLIDFDKSMPLITEDIQEEVFSILQDPRILLENFD